MKNDKTNISNSTTSKIVEGENSHSPEDSSNTYLFNSGVWENHDPQNPKEFENAYSKIKTQRKLQGKTKPKETIMIKNDKLNPKNLKSLDIRNTKSNLQNKNLINNENDEIYNDDELDEFGEMTIDRNKINSINIKENDINFLDKRKKFNG